MRLPSNIWQFKGADQSGPNVLVLGGTHGDELSGIEVCRRLLKVLGVLEMPSYIYPRSEIVGNLFVGFGNPDAIRSHTRAASSGRDLNRSFVIAELEREPSSGDSSDLKRARELAPLLRQVDYLFDIHATSNPAPAFICFGKLTERHKDIYQRFSVDRILIDSNGIIAEEYHLPEQATTDYFVDTFGGSEWSRKKFGHRVGTAICYETGHESDMSRVDLVFKDIIKLLLHVGVITAAYVKALNVDASELKSDPIQQSMYVLTQCVHAQFDGFKYEKSMDRGWQEVTKGTMLGTYGNTKKEYIVGNGIMLFPLAAHKVVKGKGLYYLAQRVLS